MEAAFSWYSETERKIYSEARERDKKADGSLGDELSESQIKINEENLRSKYYRLTPSDSEGEDDEDEVMADYYNQLEKVHEKIERNK